MNRLTNLRPPALAVLWLAVWLSTLMASELPGHARPGDLAKTVQLIVHDATWLTLWIAAWAWVTHTRQGTPRLAQHTSLAAAAALIDVAVLGTALPWAFFAMGWPWPASLYEMSRTLLIAITGLLHLRLATLGLNQTRWALWLLATTVALSLMAAQQWAEHNDKDALNQLNYQPNIYPATVVRTPEHGLEDGLKVMWGREWGEGGRAAAKD